MSDNQPNRRRSTEYKVKPLMSNLAAEEEWCSAVLADAGTWGATRSLVDAGDFYHDKTRAIADAADECMTSSPPKPTTRANIAERLRVKGLLDTSVSVDYLDKIDLGGYPLIVKQARDNARKIRSHAQRRQLSKEYRNAAEQIEDDPDVYVNVVGATAEKTTSIIAHTSQSYDPTPRNWFEKRTTNDVVKPGADSYLYKFNKWNLGIAQARVVAVNGPPKDGRKTTLVANILVKPLLDGIPISWVTVDGGQDNAFDRFAAMLATWWQVVRYNKNNHQYPRYIKWNGDAEYDQWSIPLIGISEELRSPQQRDAVAWARQKVYESKLRVYDVESGIIELPRILSYLHQDMTIVHRDEPYRAFVLDYVQEIEAGDSGKGGWQDSDYEKVLKRITVATNVYKMTSFLISQPNEAALQGKGGRSSGAKGGGKLNQVCDCWLESEYDNENAPDRLGLVLKRARYHGFDRQDYLIHPSSGLILNPNAGSLPSSQPAPPPSDSDMPNNGYQSPVGY